jgi:hypothetical protein
MAGPLGGAIGSLAAATTEDEEDVDGRPPRGCYRYFRQWPPPKLKKTSMVCSLGVMSIFLAAATTEVEDVDGGRPRGAVGVSGSGHHRS